MDCLTLWAHYDDEDDEALAEGIRNAFIAIDPATLEEPMKGSISDLSREELDLVENLMSQWESPVVFTLPTSSTVQSVLRNVASMPSIKMNDTKEITCLQPRVHNRFSCL